MNKNLKILTIIMVIMIMCSCSKVSIGKVTLKVESDEPQFTPPVAGDTVAIVHTDLGDIKIQLFPQYAPKAVENFTQLAKNGYYDGLIFHRVVENFLVQTGDDTGTGVGGKSIWGLDFTDEFSDLLHHYTGAVSMANSGENTNGSQFFILTTPIKAPSEEVLTSMSNSSWREGVINTYKQSGGAPYLDYKNTVFGQVYEGLDIAFQISRKTLEDSEKPSEEIKINSIEIITIE